MPATIKIPTVFTAIDKFSQVISRMTKGVRTFSAKGVAAIKRFDTRVTSTFRKVGKLGALIGGLTVGALFNTAIQSNIQFDKSLKSVSAITGLAGQDLANLEKVAVKTAKETRKSGSSILKAYELVGSAKPELLKNVDALDQVTRSVITLSNASGMDLQSSTKSLTDVMNQFNKDGSQAGKVIDILAAGAKEGAAAIPEISEAIVQFGTVAKQSNVSLQESVAAIEVFAAKGVKGAEAGTKMRNVLTTLATAKALPKKALDELGKFGVNLDVVSDSTLPLSDRLKEMSKISGDATAMVKVFGKENQAAGAILLQNIPQLDKLTELVNQNGVANVQAGANTNTFSFALQAIKDSFKNTTTATNSNSSAMDFLKKIMFGLADNMGTVVAIGLSLIAGFIVMKAVILAATIATTANNIAMGIAAARTGAMSLAMKNNVVAQAAFKTAMVIGTAATWLATAASTAFAVAVNLGLWPILLIIAAIVAVILVIKNWSTITDWFGKMWSKFTNWIGEAWQNVVKWFQEFDFKQMFMGIGQSILKFMLMPMKAMLTLLSNIPGKIGDLAKLGLEKIGEVTGEVDVNSQNDVLPSTSQASNEAVSRSITEKNSNVTLDIVDSGNNVGNVDNPDNIPINLGSTQGAN